MLAGTFLLSTVAIHLAVGAGESIRQHHLYLQEALQISHRSSHSSTVAALWRFKSFSCTTRRDGVYPELASSCSSYYRCLDGAVFSYVCPPGQAFHYPSEECRPAGEVTCPHLPPASPPCINQSDGYYPDYRQDCKSYYRCTNSSLSGRWQCGGDAVWDSSTGSCGTGSLLVCSPPSCWGLPDGPHPAPGSSCTSYFTCAGGVRTDHVCPYNSMFDYTLKRCVAGKSSVCYEQACEGRVNGLHAVPHAPCNSFFRCFNGALVKVEECPKHQIFDGRRCVSERNFSCWGEGRGSCEDQENGFHVSPESGCRAFFLCHQKQFIRAYKCSPGLMFNGKECVDGRNYICNARPRLPDCSSKIDGYYTMEKSECKTFFYCRGGSKISEHTCPGSNIFNGEHCVDPVLFRCPAHHDLHHPKNFTNSVIRSRRSYDVSCDSRDNGFYLDKTSRCKSFFHCQNGQKDSSSTCPHQQVFNGIQCLPEKEYTCPVRHDDAECALRGDGVYQDTEDGCSSFYQCVSGVKTLYRCPEGQLHDGQVCRAASQVFCPSSTLCYLRDDGDFVDTSRRCQGYYSCRNGTLIKYTSCDQGQLSDAECKDRDGYYGHVNTGCRTYHACKSGHRVSQACPGEQVFNGVQCVPASQFTCPTVSSCQGKVNGWYQDLSSRCRKFFYCFNGYQNELTCPGEQVFDGHTCVSSSTYTCPSVAKDRDCLDRKAGLYPDIDSLCQRYFACKNGMKVETFTCPEKHIFNGEVCVPSNTASCFPSQALVTPQHKADAVSVVHIQGTMVSGSHVPLESKGLEDPSALQYTLDEVKGSHSARITNTSATQTCAVLPNGGYAEVQSQCSSFLECGERPRWHQCPSSLMFNPINHACESSDKYTCLTSNPCHSLSDGIHTDLHSQCRVFFTCHGRKVQLISSCPEGQAFSVGDGRCRPGQVLCGGTDTRPV